MDLYTIPQIQIINQIQKMDNFEKGNEEVLLWAVVNSYNDIIQMLIDTNKLNPSKFPLKVNKYWNLALRYACERGNIETIEMLLKSGADEPSADDYIMIGKKFNKKTNIWENEKLNYTAKSAPGCIQPKDKEERKKRYYLLLLDWIYDNCSHPIFEKLKEHVETKNHTFVYTERQKNPETGAYIIRWKKENKYDDN